MNNKLIELIEKWLADPTSVTQEELKENADAATAAYANADAAYVAAYAAYAAANAAYAADTAATAATTYAADTAATTYATDARYWIKRYKETIE